MKPLLILVLLSLGIPGFGQSGVEDSLRAALQTVSSDSDKVKILLDLGRKFLHSDPPKAFEYSNRALNLAQATGDKTGEARAINNIGIVYVNLGDNQAAVEQFFKVLKIYEAIGDRKSSASPMNNLGIIHKELRNKDQALNFLNRALEIFKEFDNKRGISSAYNNIGALYLSDDVFDSALYFCNKSLEVKRELGDEGGVFTALHNIGYIYLSKKEFGKAKPKLIEARDVATRLDQRVQLPIIYSSLGELYQGMGKNDSAFFYTDKAVKLADEVHSLSALEEAYLTLSELHEWQGNHDKALEAFKMSKNYEDSLALEEVEKKMNQLRVSYELEKQQAVMTYMLQKKNAELEVAEKERKIQSLVNTVLWAGLGIAVLIVLLMWRLNWVRQRHNRQLRRLNTEINVQKTQIEQQAQRLESANQEISQINLKLEEKVKARTASLNERNKQLEEHARFNSHVLRQPVANIMGLVNMLDPDAMADEQKFAVQMLKTSSEQLDGVVRQINDNLRLMDVEVVEE